MKSTGDAKRFTIVSEEAVGKGVRRIIAVTRDAAEAAYEEAAELRKRAEGLHEAPADTLHDHVSTLSHVIEQATLPLVERAKLREHILVLNEKIKAHRKQVDSKTAEAAVEQARDIAETQDGSVIVAQIEGGDANALRSAMDVIRKKRPESAMLLAAVGDDKVALLAAVPKDLIAKGLKAGDWVKAVAQVVGGGGGGRPDMAQAGGKDPSKIQDALETAKRFAEEKV